MLKTFLRLVYNEYKPSLYRLTCCWAQKRDGSGNFAGRYEEYWRKRSSQEANDIVVERQRTTMIRINEAACSAIEALSNNVKQNRKEEENADS